MILKNQKLLKKIFIKCKHKKAKVAAISSLGLADGALGWHGSCEGEMSPNFRVIGRRKIGKQVLCGTVPETGIF